MKSMIEKTLEEFRNKFGGDVWLGADKAAIQSFLRSALTKAIKRTVNREVKK